MLNAKFNVLTKRRNSIIPETVFLNNPIPSPNHKTFVLKIKLAEKSSICYFVVCVCAFTLSQCNSLSVFFKNYAFSLKIHSSSVCRFVQVSLGKFQPSGGLFGIGCRTGTYFSRTTNDFTSKSCFSPNLCSIVFSPTLEAVCEFDGKNLSAYT